ncbi:MAG: hypothetical protein U0231_08005 [Nitrospiraceae bacterium]
MKKASGVVVAALKDSTYGSVYALPSRSLLPRHKTFLKFRAYLEYLGEEL